MPSCAAIGCSNRSEKGNLMCAFPRNPERRQLWASLVNRNNWSPTNNSFLCEVHFDENQWEKLRADGKRKLKYNAAPSIFPIINIKSGKKSKRNMKNTDKTVSDRETLNVLSNNNRVVKKVKSPLTQIDIIPNILSHSKIDIQKLRELSNCDGSTGYNIMNNNNDIIPGGTISKVLMEQETGEQSNIKILSNSNLVSEDQPKINIEQVTSSNNLIVIPVTLSNKTPMCRVCLAENEDQMLPLNSHVRLNNLSNTIMELLNFIVKKEINLDENLPCRVCFQCTQKIIDAQLFINQFELNQKILLEKYEQKSDILNMEPDHSNIIETNDVANIKSNAEVQAECNNSNSSFNDFDCSMNGSYSITEDQSNIRSTDVSEVLNTNRIRIFKKINSPEPKVHCIDCKVTIIKSEIAKHMLNCKMKVKASAVAESQRRLFICKFCSSLIYLFEKESHNKTCQMKGFIDVPGTSATNISGINRIRKNCPVIIGSPVKMSQRCKNIGMRKNVSSNKLMQCVYCKKNLYFSEIRSHRRKCTQITLDANGKPIYSCSICGNSYKLRSSLHLHVKNVHGDKTLCEICGKGVIPAMFSIHMMRHEKIRPHKCEVCNMHFVSKDELKRHNRRHTKECPFKCQYCPKSFGWRNSLKVHTMKHTGERPFSCVVCQKRFLTAFNLKNHQKVHNNISTKSDVKIKRMRSAQKTE